MDVSFGNMVRASIPDLRYRRPERQETVPIRPDSEDICSLLVGESTAFFYNERVLKNSGGRRLVVDGS